jgi:glycosyltransferase involved in cell wall biosynthesis
MTPRFSVVLNTYNRAAIVPGAIESVLGQSYDDLELLVVDDGSVDDTAAVVQGFDDPRLRYIRRDNGGLARARNTGIEAARGEYVAVLDDDDRVVPNWLERLAGPIDRDGAALVSCGVEVRAPDGQVTIRRPEPLGPAFDDQIGLFLAGTFVVRRDVLTAVGGYYEELRCSEQTELSLRLIEHCTAHGLTIAVVDEPLMMMNRESDEDRPLRRPDYLHSGSLLVLDRHGDRLRRSPALYADFVAIAAVQGGRMGHYREARRLMVDAVRAAPSNPKHWGRLAVACCPPLARRVWGVWSPPGGLPG